MRILYLDLDTLRPDHLSCYGYHRNTSPNIDWIASEGIRFENYYCSDAPCLPSRTAMMSGQFGIHTGGINHGGECSDMRLEGESRGFRTEHSLSSLPATLKRAGLHTAYIGGFGERHSTFTFYAGFREILDTGMGGMESAEHVTPAALDWIKRNAKNEDWYLQINYWDPHTPYRAPEDFGNPFKDDPLPDWIDDEVLEKHQNCVGPHCAKEVNMYNDNESPNFPRHPGRVEDQTGLRRLMDGYDCGIRYMDNHIGTLLEALKEEGVLDDLVIIVSSDHGENLGELGIYAEHGTADHITCRIPMIIRWPGKKQAHVDEGLHYNLDMVPTLADLLDLEHRQCWDGKSFAPVIESGAEAGQDYLVISQCAHVCQRSVRFGDWLYMRSYHDGFHLFPTEMLFNLTEDPYEQHNLAEERKDLCKEAVYLLNDWHDKMMDTMDSDTDPMWTVMREGGPLHARGQLERYCDYLEQTGRGWAIEQLKERHPYEFKK